MQTIFRSTVLYALYIFSVLQVMHEALTKHDEKFCYATTMDTAIFKELLFRPVDSYKYNFGHVIIVGGSNGMIGAPLLAAKAALRTGAGLVTVASSEFVIDKIASQVNEAMMLSLSFDDQKAVDKLKTYIEARHVTVVVIGPGLSIDSATSAFTRKVIQSLTLPMVIDGGGFTALTQGLDILKTATSKSIILTPHSGEFSRLLEQSLPNEREKLEPIARSFAKTYHLTLLLKGQPSFVIQSGRRTYKNSTGNPGLATAGTGDVLAGMIGALLAQKCDAFAATASAAYLHGLAGDIAAEEKTQPGVIASDVIESIPAAFKIVQAML